jgi:phage baseplate assembly protein W
MSVSSSKTRTSSPDFVGTGWKFPITVNAKGGINWSDGPERISDAIWVIIKTSLGERVMLPAFGAGANDYVFQSNSSVVRTQLVSSIKQALLKWEPRITLTQVSANLVPDEPSQVLVSIEYTINATNEASNVVYPFYLTEGAS